MVKMAGGRLDSSGIAFNCRVALRSGEYSYEDRNNASCSAFSDCRYGLPTEKTDPIITPPPSAIPASEAAEHIGEIQAVYGKVASTRYIYWTRGQPTFMNLDKPCPHQIFTIVIWSPDREKFGMLPEETFQDKTICVTGLIEEEEGLPQIVVKEPSQI